MLPDRIRILFGPSPNAGLLLPATLARHLGLQTAIGTGNTGDKMPSRWRVTTLRCAHGRCCVSNSRDLPAQLPMGACPDRVSRQLLARAWAAGAGPGDSPLTIDLDSLWTAIPAPARYHPLLAIASGNDVPAARGTARGAAHFLREAVGRVRYGNGQLTVDSGFYAHTVVCREMDVHFSIIRQRGLLIEARRTGSHSLLADVAETT